MTPRFDTPPPLTSNQLDGLRQGLREVLALARPVLDRLEAERNDPTRRRYPTSGDALSHKNRPRRFR